MLFIERPCILHRLLIPGGLFRHPHRHPVTGKHHPWRDDASCDKDNANASVEEGVHHIQRDPIAPLAHAGERRVYLTFDDGPIPEVTPWVLDLLDRYGIKATFFMVGQNVDRNPHLLQEVLRRGHRVGNHTHHHLQGIKVTSQQYVADVMEASRRIPSRLFRPPHGFLRMRQVRDLRRRGFKIIMYDLVTRDYSRRLNGKEVLAIVKKYVRDGSIIVFHDSVKSYERIRYALPRAIEWMLQQGYSFEKL